MVGYASRPGTCTRPADTDRQAAGSYLQKVTSALECGHGAMAPALGMILTDAILMTVHGVYHAERGAEPGCLGQPAYHGLYRPVGGFLRWPVHW